TVSPATTSPSGSSGDTDFAKLIADANKAPARVTYKPSDGAGFTVSQDGHGKVAYFSDDGDSQIIYDGTNAFVCSSLKSSPSCISETGAAAQATVAGYAALLTAAGREIGAASTAGNPFADTTDETIAGRDAKCVSYSVAGVGWQACADKETGLLLRWKVTGGGTSSSFEATDYTQPKDSDFTPPATPTALTPLT
ncbi:MAG TPA: hypothetical protein VFR41_08320, partial [Acidimicrobiia bacterium]|nr:hypothetical protein [Acidimicrobiia bacterium]